MFKITKKSLKINKEISEKMEGSTFHLHTHLLYDLRTDLGKSPKKYLEIGAYSGGSVSLVSSHDYPTECYSIDLGYPINRSVVEKNVERFKNPSSSFIYIKGDSRSQEIVNYIRSEIGNIDILFIDGDHSRHGVISDYLNYGSLINPGGYLVFDDYLDYENSPEVKPAVDYIIETIDSKKYEILGSLSYDFLKDFTELEKNNLFIIKKIEI